MLIWGDTRATAEAAAGPSPLALKMLRAARELSRAEARMRDDRSDGEAANPGLSAQQAQADLEAAVAQFCSTAPHLLS